MKKHEAMKFAYDNYPKGTKFKSAAISSINESTGIFQLLENGSISMVPDQRGCLVYSVGSDKWAEIIPESLLSGKCTIQVNNDREFDLLMSHYETKDWQWKVNGGRGIPTIVSFPFLVSYENEFHWSFVDGHAAYKKIQFNDFADEIGVSVPVFVMTSEDGAKLYKGDTVYHVWLKNNPNEWTLLNKYTLGKQTHKSDYNDSNKAFSTKEAAEKWVKEHNEPKVIGLVFQSEAPAEVSVTAKNIYIYPKKYMHCHFSGEELEQIYDAYTSLR